MPAPTTAIEQLERLTRRAEHVEVRTELAARLEEGRPLRVKLGVDPTARDVTLGWAVPLRKLREFQDAGHTAVLIMGDFTARIGDPSGRSETRPRLEKEVVRANAEACLRSLHDILSEDNLEVRYNSEWLEPMDLSDVLRLTSLYTVARLLERDDFAKRHAEGRPISIIEFMYPLLQGYDSVAVEADVELGGTDQLFNLLVARDLQRAHGQRPQIALTMPLLVGTDGVQKMSQSLHNYVSIRDDPADMYGKLMSIADHLVPQYAALAADLPEEEVHELSAAARAGGPGAGDAKRRIARAVVALYHGDEASAAAEAAFNRQFVHRSAPEEVPEAPIPADAVDGDLVYLPRVLAQLGLASSRGEGRRLIAQGGVRVNGEVVSGESWALGDLRGALLQVGRRRFVRLRD
ncbi:MAG TPA: tyrosine--tRNA ligase [Actinomycetota bacterium]|nr:tyrosine--tRNA ligase [Actinomycetota bacterium]